MLEDFQRTILADYFAGTTETLILLPKKSGKTSLLAALALYHLITTPEAECMIAAASRDQATILYDQAAGFVRRSPGLQKRVEVKGGYRQIRSLRDSGRIRVLAADADTADGVIPTLALVDELHRHKSADLYGVFRDGLGPRDGQIITISTAGSDRESPLYVIRAAALERGYKRTGAYLRAGAGQFVLHEWSLQDDDDLDDIALVKTCNPLSVSTVEKLRTRHDSPSMTPWAWARFACNVWTSAEEDWLPSGAWDACFGDATLPDFADVYVGVDIGVKKDSSAVAVCWRRPEDDRIISQATVFSPSPGVPLDLAKVENHLRELAEQYVVWEVRYDRWSFERSAQMLSDEGLLMVDVPMTNERVVPMSAGLYELIVSGRLVHDGDPVLAAHVAAGTIRETERGWRIAKGKAKRPMDALVALMLAASGANQSGDGGGIEF